jgi:hypothetical protein
MPYGTPTSNSANAEYGIVMRYGSSFIPFNLTLPNASLFDEQDCKDAFQAVLDGLSQIPDLEVQAAGRSYPTAEDVTPTP